MQQVIPALRITNYARSKAFYVEGLHFTVAWEHRFEPGFPVFMELTREGMSIYLTEHSGDCQVGGLVHFFVPDVDAWYAEWQSQGIAIEPPNEDLPGLRGIWITDPDGNQLRVMTRLT
jgi:predicted enzyme related to lactoylglutathione lyase